MSPSWGIDSAPSSPNSTLPTAMSCLDSTQPDDTSAQVPAWLRGSTVFSRSSPPTGDLSRERGSPGAGPGRKALEPTLSEQMMAPPAGFDRRPPPPPVPGLRGCLPLAFAPMTPVRPEGPPRAQHSCSRGCPRSYGGLVPPADRRKVTPDGRSLALSPPWTPAASVAASLLVALVAALVWHTRWPNPADAELMRLQEAARVRGDGIATAIAYAVGPLVVLAVLGERRAGLAGQAVGRGGARPRRRPRYSRHRADAQTGGPPPATRRRRGAAVPVGPCRRRDRGGRDRCAGGQGHAGTTADKGARRLAGGLARGRHRRGASGADRPLHDRRRWRRRPRARRDWMGGAGDYRGVPARPAHGGSIASSGTTLHLPAGQDERLPRDSPGAN